MSTWFDKLIIEALQNDTQVILFLILVVSAIIVLDAITKVAKLQRKKAGIHFKQIESALPGRKCLEAKDYVAVNLALAGRPDGILVENGFTIPVEFKPLAKKLRDRYIIQILVYLRLIEEATGKKPPYGYLILGKNSKQIKIYNSEQKQAELASMVATMKSIAHENACAKADPATFKCKSCSARKECKFTIRTN